MAVYTDRNSLLTFKVSEFFFKAFDEFSQQPIIENDLKLEDMNESGVGNGLQDYSAEPKNIMVLENTNEEAFLPS